MQNFIVILIIGAILFFAIKPIIRYKKQTGSCYSCYGCSHNKGGECNIKGIVTELKNIKL